MKCKKIIAAIIGIAITATVVASLSLTSFFADAADESIGTAYLCYQAGADSFWNADSEYLTAADITGDGSYSVTATANMGSGSIECMILTTDINAFDYAEEGASAGNYGIPEGCIAYIAIDSIEIQRTSGETDTIEYTGPSDGAFRTNDDGSTIRVNIWNIWQSPNITDLGGSTSDDETKFEFADDTGINTGDVIVVNFTVSGTDADDDNGDSNGDNGDTTDSDVPSDAIAEAYFLGNIGAEYYWGADSDSNTGNAPTTTYITGDGTYTVTWDLANGGTDTVEFLAVVISPVNGIENFTTDTFTDLVVTLDEVKVDGVAISDYTVSDNAIDTAYYESGAGVTRIYLHDDWAGTGVADLASETTITTSIEVIFTISGAEYANDMGDVDGDGDIDVQDAYIVQVEFTNISAGKDASFTDAQKTAADINEDGEITIRDAYYIQVYFAQTSADMNPTWEDVLAG